MVFSSPLFLFVFLPIVLTLYYFASHSFKNIVLLCASLLFYIWGEPRLYYVIIFSIIFNWAIGVLIYKFRKYGRIFLTLGIILNLFLLIHYKYFNFFIDIFNDTVGHFSNITLRPETIIMPLGISFFTFHSISYIVDIYRSQNKPMFNPLNVGLYISLFPQLIAGPIIRYHDISEQIRLRSNSLERFYSGVERFVFGLGKKILLANTFGNIADMVFNSDVNTLTFFPSWLGIICYTLQIYYDFSGYSDMAIGLGRMFGFELLENFNYPYIATSVRDFWRRWHLSLSAWFRDYLYIPLGGSRVSRIRTEINLFTVFLLCGLWHGASWTFILWGCLHGFLLVLERGKLGDFLQKSPSFIGRIYTIIFVMFAWILFRSDSTQFAARYIETLFNIFNLGGISTELQLKLSSQFYIRLFFGLILSTPLFAFISTDWDRRKYPISSDACTTYLTKIFYNFFGKSIFFFRMIAVAMIFCMSISELAISTYNPFIYFRF